MNKRTFFKAVLLTASTAFLISPLISQQASVDETKRAMKTYPFSDPNPVANIGTIYPYYRFDGYSLAGADQRWNVVKLENPFVKLWVFPEIGGKLWGAVEKSTEQEFIYFNKVVKFRNIAMRGPWTSGGVELNFGIIGHSPITSSPVDYLYKTNADGSVSCIVGAIDLPSRTRWHVDIRLPEDKAYIETRCFWYNPTPLHQPLYHWMTSAENAGDDLRFYYPGTHYIGHGGEPHPWPIETNGRDISAYANNNFGSSKSYHILGEYDEHFGGYWEDKDFGYGHWALYDDKPGQKLWIWSLGRDGAIWHDLLTDPEGNPQYVEPQTGLQFNQEAVSSSLTPFKHAYFQPHSVTRWKEIWFPVKGIGGMVDASPYGTLNVSRTNGKIRIGICPLQKLDDRLAVALDGVILHTELLSLQPMEVYTTTLNIPETSGELTVSVGERKLFYTNTPDVNILSRPVRVKDGFDWNTPEGLFIAGEELMRQRKYMQAELKFQSCLAADPSHIRSKTRLAEITYRRGEYDTALSLAADVLAVDTYDPGGNFIFGEINRTLGRLQDAKEAFGWAARSMEYRSAAYARMAAICLSENDLMRAEEYARRSLDYNRFNLSGALTLSVVFRLKKDRVNAEKILEELLEIDPLCHTARFERYLWDETEENLGALKKPIQNEFPYETYLEMALEYLRMGRRIEAVKMLEIAPSYPVIDFWLAYLYRNSDQEKSARILEKACAASPFLVFPFRRESISVFNWALTSTDSWKAHYYLGLILWNIGRGAEAATHFEMCRDTPDFMPFYLCRSRFYRDGQHPEKSLQDLLKARAMAPEDWRAAHILSDFYLAEGNDSKALENSESVFRQNPENYILAMDYARALLRMNRFNDSLRILSGTTILPYEGAQEGHDVFRQAQLLKAASELEAGNPEKALKSVSGAREWPENLGVGRPYIVDERLEDFVAALAYESMGKKNKALDIFQNIVEHTKKIREKKDADFSLALFAMKRMGNHKEAAALLSEWKTTAGPENPVLRWADAVLTGNQDVILTIQNKRTSLDKDSALLIRIEKMIDL